MRGRVAQSVEQRIENPRVDGSIPPLATIKTPFGRFFVCPVVQSGKNSQYA